MAPAALGGGPCCGLGVARFARLGMTENAVRQAFYRFRQRYQSLLREEIAHTVATPGDIEDELRHLIAVIEA